MKEYIAVFLSALMKEVIHNEVRSFIMNVFQVEL
jgi:hypothetical protein